MIFTYFGTKLGDTWDIEQKIAILILNLVFWYCLGKWLHYIYTADKKLPPVIKDRINEGLAEVKEGVKSIFSKKKKEDEDYQP